MNRIHTRAQIEMIGVAEYYLGFYIIAELVHMDTLDGTDRTDGHENRSLDRAMVSFDKTGSGATIGACMLECELH